MKPADPREAAALGVAAARKPLGQRLLDRGVLAPDQLRVALLEQKARNEPLGKVLVALGFVTEAVLQDALADDFGVERVELARVIPDAAALKLVPKEFARAHRVFPVSAEGDALRLAMANPRDVIALDRLQPLLPPGMRVGPLLAADTDVATAIETHYDQQLSIEDILHEIETGRADLSAQSDGGYRGPVVRLVEAILADAAARRASDIHFEPEDGFVRIRYRIDGVLRQVRALHLRYWPPMLMRLKIVSEMNVAESRAAQDGRASLTVNGRTIDFRAAVQPTIHGENFVLRVLDRARGLVPLDRLGYSEAQLAAIETMLNRPVGILLVTGPTGSGKTTTLYSMLAKLNRPEVNIMTLEDPVEYPLPLVRQTNLAAGVKMDFANGIRSLMRQDPDIILLGEIRDADTATMALRAAMTGHQVFSTLHTNSAIGALPRLFDLGVKPMLLAGNLIGIVAQRLVRRLCTHCRQPYTADAATVALLGAAAEGATLYRPVGCGQCDHTGYRGRLALSEVLRFDEQLDDMLAAGAAPHELARAARQSGFTTLAEDALRRVLDGSSSLAEVARVVDLTRLAAAPVQRQG